MAGSEDLQAKQDAFYRYIDEDPNWGQKRPVSLSQHAYSCWADLASKVPSFDGAYTPAQADESRG